MDIELHEAAEALRTHQAAGSARAARLREAARAAARNSAAAASGLRDLRAAAAAMRDSAAAVCVDTAAALRDGVCGVTAGLERELQGVLGRHALLRLGARPPDRTYAR